MHHSLNQCGDIDTIPPAAAECLRKAGWTPARVVSTRDYEEAYRAEGRPLLPTAKVFLSRFGGLIIQYPTKSHCTDVLAFLADREIHAMNGSGLECFEEIIGVAPLCAIGHYQFGTCILFMDQRGRVFGGSDETTMLVGRSGEEAVSNILTGLEGEMLEPTAGDKTS